MQLGIVFNKTITTITLPHLSTILNSKNKQDNNDKW